MSLSNLNFTELKARVSIIDVATHLGYRYDPTKGAKQPSFVIADEAGHEIDRIYIKNPDISASQGYWKRSGEKGDLINFVKSNLHKFSTKLDSSLSDYQQVSMILHDFANHTYTRSSNDTATRKVMYQKQEFDPQRWEIKDDALAKRQRDKILSSRGISEGTFYKFSKHINMIHDAKANHNYSNIAFPYHRPGDDKLQGYEIRGLKGFKAKSAGTDSTTSMWIADFSKSKEEVKNIFIAESAFDALAFYEIYQKRINLENSVFVSVGGSFSDKQFKGLIDHYNLAKPILLFDNDIHGKIYDIRAYCIKADKDLGVKKEDDKIIFKYDNKDYVIKEDELTLSQFQKLTGLRLEPNSIAIMKPQHGKDWNDQLLSKQENETTKYQVNR